jgi:AcrR family transcriptional regulator
MATSSGPSVLQQSIITAVDDLVRSRGWSATTMSDVAKAAGVSRQTVYNEFGSRANRVQAYVVREIEALLAEVDTRVRANADNARQALTDAFEVFLKLASDEPLVRVIVADADGGEVIRLLTDIGRSVATDQVGALINEVWPQISLSDARLLADSMARLAISHALLPTEEPEQTAVAVTRIFGPYLDELLSVEQSSWPTEADRG